MISAMCTGSEAAFPAMSGEDGAHGFGLRRHDKDFLVRSRIAERDRAADPDPFALRRRVLSRTRSPITSRSNWAKDNRTLRVSRPMLVVVLNDWVTETKDVAYASKISI